MKERQVAVTCSVDRSFEGVSEILLGDPAAVLGTPAEAGGANPALATEISVELGAGSSVHQELALEVGPVEVAQGVARMALQWHAAGRESLFPTFAGSLEATADGAETKLALRGCYRTPLGRLGAFGDEVIGWRLARSALEGYVNEVGHRLEARAPRRTSDPALVPAATPEEPPCHTELYLG